MNPEYTIFVPLALAGIVPLGFFFDAVLPRHRAVLATLLTGFLFLPSAQFELGPFNWNRITAPVCTILLGMMIRDLALIARFRPRWYDIPVLCWCLAPGLSSLSNGLGLRDALSTSMYQTLWIGAPYFIGRIHITTRKQLIDLGKVIVLGCLIYVPLCLYEIRMSPTLHQDLYGYSQHNFAQTLRGSFFRPMVFMQHGLMAAMWMGMGSLLAISMALAFKQMRIFQVPLRWWALGLTLTLIAMQSLGAILLFMTAWSVLLVSRRTGSPLPLLALALFPLIWCGLRTSGALPSASIVNLATIASEERAESLAFRLQTEDDLAHHVLQRPLFGWSSWGRDRIVESEYQERTLVLDGHWIIKLSQNGFFGLTALLTAHLFPLLLLLRRVRVSTWRNDGTAQVLGCLGIVLATSMVDNLFNSMINPFFILLIGAVPSVAASWQVAEAVPDESLPEESPGIHGPRVLGA